MAFVYRTPRFGFPEPLAPLITIDERLDIGTWTHTVSSNPLTALFDKIFDHDPVGREIAGNGLRTEPKQDSIFDRHEIKPSRYQFYSASYVREAVPVKIVSRALYLASFDFVGVD